MITVGNNLAERFTLSLSASPTTAVDVYARWSGDDEVLQIADDNETELAGMGMLQMLSVHNPAGNSAVTVEARFYGIDNEGDALGVVLVSKSVAAGTSLLWNGSEWATF